MKSYSGIVVPLWLIVKRCKPSERRDARQLEEYSIAYSSLSGTVTTFLWTTGSYPPPNRAINTATVTFAVTLATVMNMSTTTSSAMSRPIPSTGRLNAR